MLSIFRCYKQKTTTFHLLEISAAFNQDDLVDFEYSIADFDDRISKIFLTGP